MRREASEAVVRDSNLLDRQALVRGAVTIAAAIVVGLAFVFSYVGGLHQPTFHDVPLAVVGPLSLVRQLDARGEFSATRVASRQAAIDRIDERKDFGAIIAGPNSTDVLVAPKASLAVANVLRTTLGPRLRATTGTSSPVRIIDVKPLPRTDPSGVSPFYLALGLVVGSYLGAVFFAFSFGTRPAGGRVWWRLLGVGVISVVLGLSEVGIVNALGPLRGHYIELVLVAILLGTTVGTVTVGLQSFFGILGTSIAILLFVVLGNPASGGIYPMQLLPGFWRTIGPYLPSASGVELVRNIAYFDGNATTRPLLVLCAWLTVALVLVVLSTRARPPGRSAAGISQRIGGPTDSRRQARSDSPSMASSRERSERWPTRSS
jgi:hypothetical protein